MNIQGYVCVCECMSCIHANKINPEMQMCVCECVFYSRASLLSHKFKFNLQKANVCAFI